MLVKNAFKNTFRITSACEFNVHTMLSCSKYQLRPGMTVYYTTILICLLCKCSMNVITVIFHGILQSGCF